MRDLPFSVTISRLLGINLPAQAFSSDENSNVPIEGQVLAEACKGASLEVFESLTQDILDGDDLIIGQLLKLAFAPLAA